MINVETLRLRVNFEIIDFIDFYEVICSLIYSLFLCVNNILHIRTELGVYLINSQ